MTKADWMPLVLATNAKTKKLVSGHAYTVVTTSGNDADTG